MSVNKNEATSRGIADTIVPAAQIKIRQATAQYDVAIIGAGPYGLSAAAHLKSKGIAACVFGEPMSFWANQMPLGMLLRSPRVASNLSDPGRAFTLEAYEADSSTEARAPLPLDTFVEYGRWFQQRLGSDLDPRTVSRVEQDYPGFRLTLHDGEEIRSKAVVVATGVGPFKRTPKVFQNLPPQRAIHCYECRDIARFAGKSIAVIGAGQSALESAALLHGAKANVEIISRRDLRWIGQHRWLHHMGPVSSMLYSWHDVGPAGISRLVAYPRIVACVPLKLRDKIRTRAVRPAGSRWLPDRLANVKITTGCSVSRAQSIGDELILKLDDGSDRRVDHVLLGTGYDVDISRYEFLPPALTRQIRQFNGYPRLGRGFRSSVPGLHFVGATAARSFGPLLYFVAGTEFASRELSSHLAKI
ncbi:MAG: NAD(P)/FAD-dependent oxidoreductase [Acidobacteriales bacterium]|nr:NAD(P)/FAD-dependent oxidoreductase [Terriglobales bacterium]